MAERTTSTQGVLIAIEDTAGTPPASAADYVRLQSLGISLNPNPELDPYKPQGNKYVTSITLLREYSSGNLTGRATYDEIVYPLSSVLTVPEITAAAGTTSAAAGSRTMTDGTHFFFRPRAADADSYNTMTVVEGSIVRAHRASYVTITDFNMAIGVDDSSLGGTASGNALEDNVAIPGNEVQTLTVNATGGTYTLTFGGQTTSAIAYNASEAVLTAALEALSTIPTDALYINQTSAVSPFVYTIQFGGSLGATDVGAITATTAGLTGGASTAVVVETTAGAAVGTVTNTALMPGDVCIYMFDSPPADISDTTNETATYRLERVHSIGWRMNGRYTPYNVINCSINGNAANIEADPTLEMDITLQADEQGMSFLTAMRAGTTKYIRIKATGDAIDDGGSDDFEFTLDFAGKVSASQEFGDDQSVWAKGWTLTGVPQLTNGGPIEVAVVNTLTGL